MLISKGASKYNTVATVMDGLPNSQMLSLDESEVSSSMKKGAKFTSKGIELILGWPFAVSIYVERVVPTMEWRRTIIRVQDFRIRKDLSLVK